MRGFERTRRTVLIILFGFLGLQFAQSSMAETNAIILPVDFESYLLTAGGTRELQPEWTEAGSGFLQLAINKSAGAMFTSVDMPALSAEEQKALDEHMALYQVATGNSITMIKTAKLKHKIKNYDYTVGPGLAFLKEKTGADKLVLLTGEQEKSSGGRIAIMVLGVAVGAATGYGVVPAIGGSYCTIGIIDLETGNLEWVNYMMPMQGDARKEDSASTLVDKVMGQFPFGILMESSVEY